MITVWSKIKIILSLTLRTYGAGICVTTEKYIYQNSLNSDYGIPISTSLLPSKNIVTWVVNNKLQHFTFSAKDPMTQKGSQL